MAWYFIIVIILLLALQILNWYFHIYRSCKLLKLKIDLTENRFGLCYKLPSHNRMLYSFKPLTVEAWISQDIIDHFEEKFKFNPYYVDEDGPSDMYRLCKEYDKLWGKSDI